MHQIIEERLICCFTNEEKLLAKAFTVHKFAVSKILVLANFSLRNSVLNVSGKCSKPVSLRRNLPLRIAKMLHKNVV